MFCGNPGVLSLGHCSDTIMQTNVSAELRDSIYPLSNYINRSWIVTNGSWRGRRGKQHTTRSWRGPRCMIAFFHPISLSHSSLPRSLPVLLLEIPPSTIPNLHTCTYKHTHTHTQSHESFSSLKDFYFAEYVLLFLFLLGRYATRHQCLHYSAQYFTTAVSILTMYLKPKSK